MNMNFFEESELERQQRLYELQRLYQEYDSAGRTRRFERPL
jgi:hypothetical protein